MNSRRGFVLRAAFAVATVAVFVTATLSLMIIGDIRIPPEDEREYMARHLIRYFEFGENQTIVDTFYIVTNGSRVLGGWFEWAEGMWRERSIIYIHGRTIIEFAFAVDNGAWVNVTLHVAYDVPRTGQTGVFTDSFPILCGASTCVDSSW